MSLRVKPAGFVGAVGVIVLAAVALSSLTAPRVEAATPQAIFFSPGFISNKTVGAPPIAVSATATSGLPVSLVASGPCTVSGPSNAATVTITGIGSCSITASQAGGSGFDPATPVVRSFTISKANQTITFASIFTHTYGDAPFAASATASSGLPVAFSALGQCSIAGSTVTILGAGSCSITASQAGDPSFNAATPVTRNFTIWKASQTISFGAFPSSATYGATPIPISPTSSAGLPVSLAIVSGPCQVVDSVGNPASTSPAFVKINGAGSCWIQASQAGNANVNSAFSSSKILSVGRAPLTVQAHSVIGKVYGAPVPPIGGTITGFVNGDVSVGGSLTCNSTASTLSSPGTYQTSCFGLNSPNYNITYLKGTLTVIKADQTISIDAAGPKTYGDSSFSLTTHSSSGQFVTLSSDDTSVCTVSANWFGPVVIVGAGTCKIRAQLGASANYNAAPDATLDIIVNPAPLTITADNVTITEGQIPAFTAHYSGFVNFENASSAAATTFVSCGAGPGPFGVGTYPITCTGDFLNYAETFVAGTLTVNAP